MYFPCCQFFVLYIKNKISKLVSVQSYLNTLCICQYYKIMSLFLQITEINIVLKLVHICSNYNSQH